MKPEKSSREIKMTKVKSKSKSQVHSMWLCSAVQWRKKKNSNMVVGFVKSRQSLKFDKKFSSNQGSRAVALVIEKVIYYSVPVQEVTFQAKE